MSKDSIMNT